MNLINKLKYILNRHYARWILGEQIGLKIINLIKLIKNVTKYIITRR